MSKEMNIPSVYLRGRKPGDVDVLTSLLSGLDISWYDVGTQLKVDPDSMIVAADAKDRPIGNA